MDNSLVVQEVVIVRTGSGSFSAVTVFCRHEGKKEVTFRKSNNDFYCPENGPTYNIAGKGTNSDGSGGVTVYQTTFSGSKLSIIS